MVDLREWVEDNGEKGFQAQIFDRHRLISEPIYGPLLRDKAEPGFDDYFWFTNMLTQFYDAKPILIYCLPPFASVWNNIKDDPDNKVVSNPKTAWQLWGAYFNKAMTDWTLYDGVWIYDYTDSRRPQTFDMLSHYIKTRISYV